MTQTNDELKEDKLYLILKLQTELQQTREELDYHKQALIGAENMMNERFTELEQVKAERDKWESEARLQFRLFNELIEEDRRHREERDFYKNVRDPHETLLSLRTELAAKDKVLEFAKEVLRVAFAGGSLDGGDIQEMGVKYGLLEQTAYDPERHEENGDFEPGDPYFTFTPILSQYK